MSRLRATPREKAQVHRWLSAYEVGQVAWPPPTFIQRIIDREAKRKVVRRESAKRRTQVMRESWVKSLGKVFGGAEVRVNDDGTYTMKHPYAPLRMRERQ